LKPLPLGNIRVLDLTRFWSGPYGTQILGALGAEVIRVESPVHVDPTRYMLPPDKNPGERAYNRGSYFHMTNRDKNSVVIDLQTTVGRELLLTLVSIADVVVENFSARVVGNLGIEYDDLKKVRPDVIMVSMPGFGSSGPYRDYVCFGEALEGMTGLSHLTGNKDGPPVRSAGAFTDPASGMWAVYGILAALQRRNRTGQGCQINLSQQEGYISLLGELVMDFTVNGRIRKRLGNCHPNRAPQGVYRCRGNDRWVSISVSSDKEWHALCTAMGCPELGKVSKFGNVLARFRLQGEIDKLIENWTVGLEARYVMATLQSMGVPCAAVATVDELFSDPYFEHRRFFDTVEHPEVGTFAHFGMPFKLAKSSLKSRSPAPLFAEHNRRVFCEVLGLDSQGYQQLLAERISAENPVIPDDTAT